jgi:hypothetical protein
MPGARLNAGLPLYPGDADINRPDTYFYPPLLAIVFRPLALLPFEVAALLWEVAMIASLALTIRLLTPRGAILAAIAILAFPIAWSLAIGQAQVLITWLLAVASPWSVALAGQIKVFPALAAVYWIGRRDWRALRRFALWSFGLVALQVVLEPRGSMSFLGFLNPSLVGEVNNLSPYEISPALWAVLVAAGAILAIRLAPSRHGWAAAVSLSVLAPPRLLSYMFMALLAGLSRAPDRRAGRQALGEPRSDTG